MENEHAAYFDLDFILATCFMDEDEKMAVKNVIQNKTADSDEDGVEEVTVTEISVKTEIDVEAPFQSSKRERADSEPSRKSSKRERNENRSETHAVKKAKVETGLGEVNQSKASLRIQMMICKIHTQHPEVFPALPFRAQRCSSAMTS